MEKKSFFSAQDLFAKKTNDSAKEEDVSSMPQTAFTQEQLQETWNAYVRQLEEKGKQSIAATLRYKAPILGENHHVHFEIFNAVQQEYMVTAKAPLLDFLRSTLKNWSIQLTVELNTDGHAGPTIKTDSERLRELMDENEDLRDFIKRLDLDWE